MPNFASVKDPKFPLFEKKMREMIGGVDANGNPDPNGKRFLFTTIAGNLGQGPQCDAAGLAALLLEKNPDYTPEQLETIIKATSTRVANADETTAGGRVASFDLISKIPRRRAAHH